MVQPGRPALAEIADHFGPDVIRPDGTLDRPALGAIVFAEEDERQVLNGITHPRITQEMGARIADLQEDGAPVIVDSPLLIEMGHAEDYPVIIVVLATPEIQHRRLVTERGMDPDEAWGANQQSGHRRSATRRCHPRDRQRRGHVGAGRPGRRPGG